MLMGQIQGGYQKAIKSFARVCRQSSHLLSQEKCQEKNMGEKESELLVCVIAGIWNDPSRPYTEGLVPSPWCCWVRQGNFRIQGLVEGNVLEGAPGTLVPSYLF